MHFGISMEGTDILPAVALGEGAQGFTTPLQADLRCYLRAIQS